MFYLHKCYSDCYKPLADFQISEKVDSLCLPSVFIAYMEERLFSPNCAHLAAVNPEVLLVVL